MAITLYSWKCDYCGCDYEMTSSQYHRLKDGRQKSGYCSKECKSNSQKRTVIKQCAYCGVDVERTEYHASINENTFCSQACKSKFLYETTRENRMCEMCGELYLTKKISSQRFCSPECANEYQKTRVGKLNAKYKRVEITCEYCGESFDEMQYRLKDDCKHFCSMVCRQAWFAEVFSQSEDFKQLLRNNIIAKMENRVVPNLDSKPQLIVDDILDSLKVKYQREYNIKYYSVDNYLIDYNLMIEVQGDYFHVNPLKYDDLSQINDTQYQRIGKDKAKHSYIKNQYGIEVLYLWERDIVNNPELCKKLIKEYISNHGDLANYNSFNYSISDDNIQLNTSVILSYQERN